MDTEWTSVWTEREWHLSLPGDAASGPLNWPVLYKRPSKRPEDVKSTLSLLTSSSSPFWWWLLSPFSAHAGARFLSRHVIHRPNCVCTRLLCFFSHSSPLAKLTSNCVYVLTRGFIFIISAHTDQAIVQMSSRCL